MLTSVTVFPWCLQENRFETLEAEVPCGHADVTNSCHRFAEEERTCIRPWK